MLRAGYAFGENKKARRKRLMPFSVTGNSFKDGDPIQNSREEEGRPFHAQERI
jgi:hypothetical protein